MNIYKCKLNGVFYIVVEKYDDKYVRAVNIEDKYSYTIPIEDLELWLEFEENTSNCNSCKYQNEVDGSNCYECSKGICNNYTAEKEWLPQYEGKWVAESEDKE